MWAAFLEATVSDTETTAALTMRKHIGTRSQRQGWDSGSTSPPHLKSQDLRKKWLMTDSPSRVAVTVMMRTIQKEDRG
jgi:hypothetical protein